MNFLTFQNMQRTQSKLGKTNKLCLIFLVVLLIYGCTAKPEPSIFTTPYPESGYGFISFGFDGHWEIEKGRKKRERVPDVSTLVIQSRKARGVTRARLKERSELKILVVPVGEYRVTDFLISDSRLTLPNKSKRFSVSENELVYLGKYHFTFFLSRDFIGLPTSTFDFKYINDYEEKLPIIASQLESTYPDKMDQLFARYEFPFGALRYRFRPSEEEENPASSDTDI